MGHDFAVFGSELIRDLDRLIQVGHVECPAILIEGFLDEGSA